MGRFYEGDKYLEAYSGVIERRTRKYRERKVKIESGEGVSLCDFSSGYHKFGLIKERDGILYREWAPGAKSISLIGDFNGWNRDFNQCQVDENGVWSTFLFNNEDGIPHLSKIKASVGLESGAREDRIPVWCRYVTQDSGNPLFDGRFWNPPSEFEWIHRNPVLRKDEGLRIYECHVGMSSMEPKVSTYREFMETVLPRVKDLGYNAIQLMSILEHPYYASFGYQVTHLFAPSSRFGTPDDFKRLVDKAHGMGILVIVDLVHSHSSGNIMDGLNKWDGTDFQYFHGGSKGKHEIWESFLFDFGKWEVLRLLLSNLRYYIEEFHVNGFRFDAVTSILYTHHGIGVGFSGTYDEYFGDDVDEDGLAYLMLANDVCHSLDPHVITIAEDVSGYPGLCAPIEEGGVGFDYRMAMAIPDIWKHLLSKVQDDDWEMGKIVHALTNRRSEEKTLAYCECHDQAIVGDKTIAFWLMDKEMYTGMSMLKEASPVVHRGISLHKMIRLITYSLGADAYLNFMGNEFGHPEWIDFPRPGNNDSFLHALRRWDLADDGLLRYSRLLEFDKAMHRLEHEYHWLCSRENFVSRKNETDKVICFERHTGTVTLVFIFNFHPTRSFDNYGIGVSTTGKYVCILSSDENRYGGLSRVTNGGEYYTHESAVDGFEHALLLYIPSRTALILQLTDE